VKHLPLFFDLAGRRVVVIGQGLAADRRAELARSPAPRYSSSRPSRCRPQRRRRVFVATGNLDATPMRAAPPRLPRAGECRRPAWPQRLHPAGIIDRGEVVVAISTGGASPSLATLLRARIEAAAERIGALARLAQTFRARPRL